MTRGRLVTPNIRLLRELGRGGTGTVWIADHLALGAQVAVKLLDSAYANDMHLARRFTQEARSLAVVSHPHIVRVFDCGVTAQGEPFIVMELLRGETLGTLIERCGALPLEEVVEIIGQTAKALDAVHRMGIVHRDVQPENLFIVDNDGQPFIKVLDVLPANLTTTNARIGTLAYMSPEQCTNSKQIDSRTDLWALGVVAYETLTGTRPFYGDTLMALAMAVSRGHFRPPSTLRHDLPKAVDAWMSKALAIDSEQRFGSANEMADSLISLLNPYDTKHRVSSILPTPLANVPAPIVDAPKDWHLNSWFPENSDNGPVRLPVGNPARLCVNVGPPHIPQGAGQTSALDAAAALRIIQKGSLDILVLCPGARVKTVRKRMPLPPDLKTILEFAITPLRTGKLELQIVLLIKNEPIHRTFFPIEAFIHTEMPAQGVVT